MIPAEMTSMGRLSPAIMAAMVSNASLGGSGRRGPLPVVCCVSRRRDRFSLPLSRAPVMGGALTPNPASHAKAL